MSSRLFRFSAAVFCAAWLMPASATASPITDLKLLHGEGFLLSFGQHLTPEDLLVLASRDDHGWHLGWFKPKLRHGGSGYDVVDLGVSTWVPTLPTYIPPNTLTPLTGPLDPAQASDAGGTSPAAVIAPEPTSLLLLGTGLMFVARRIQRRRTTAL